MFYKGKSWEKSSYELVHIIPVYNDCLVIDFIIKFSFCQNSINCFFSMKAMEIIYDSKTLFLSKASQVDILSSNHCMYIHRVPFWNGMV